MDGTHPSMTIGAGTLEVRFASSRPVFISPLIAPNRTEEPCGVGLVSGLDVLSTTTGTVAA